MARERALTRARSASRASWRSARYSYADVALRVGAKNVCRCMFRERASVLDAYVPRKFRPCTSGRCKHPPSLPEQPRADSGAGLSPRAKRTSRSTPGLERHTSQQPPLFSAGLVISDDTPIIEGEQ